MPVRDIFRQTITGDPDFVGTADTGSREAEFEGEGFEVLSVSWGTFAGQVQSFFADFHYVVAQAKL